MAEFNPIVLNIPTRYTSGSQPGPYSPSQAPSTDWLAATWSVTHSTLEMWRSARNVRITYAPLPAARNGRQRVDDLVEWEPSSKQGVVKRVTGIDTQAEDGCSWDWRGRGWLFFVTSHWEILGWGEATTQAGRTERWAVTWFAPTLFTKEGIDIYCDCREGLSEETYNLVMEALRNLEVKELVGLVQKDMKSVEIKLPWTENCCPQRNV